MKPSVQKLAATTLTLAVISAGTLASPRTAMGTGPSWWLEIVVVIGGPDYINCYVGCSGMSLCCNPGVVFEE